VSTRTQKRVWYEGNTPNILRTFAFPPEHWSRPIRRRGLWRRVRGDFQRCKSLRQTCTDVHHRRSTKECQSTLSKQSHSTFVITNETYTLADLLPRGRNVEALNTSKHSATVRCHYHPFPAYLELDARRGPTGISQGEFWCEPIWTCGCPFSRICPTLTPVASYLTWLRASTTSTPAV